MCVWPLQAASFPALRFSMPKLVTFEGAIFQYWCLTGSASLTFPFAGFTSTTGATYCSKACVLILVTLTCGPLPIGYGGVQQSLLSTWDITKCMAGTYGSPTLLSSIVALGMPCTACPTGMTTPDTNPALASSVRIAFVNDASSDCVTQPGYGWTGSVAVACTAGTYSAGYTLNACATCPNGKYARLLSIGYQMRVSRCTGARTCR
jgi:hypothetical protein